jgi:uncharacterized integral membrane protein (TIGR00697 family)
MIPNKKILFLLTIYLTALFASNTLGLKLMPFLFDTHLSVSIFFFPIVFLLTDVIGEVYGREVSRMFVRMGLYATLFFTLANLLANLVPFEAGFYLTDAYIQVFGLSFRFALASLVAFAVGEYQDVFSFFYLKAKLNGRFFLLRSLLSNVWSQLLDSVIWFGIAYAGVMPVKEILLTLIPWWIFKVIAGAFYSPLTIPVIKFLKKDESLCA